MSEEKPKAKPSMDDLRHASSEFVRTTAELVDRGNLSVEGATLLTIKCVSLQLDVIAEMLVLKK